MFIFHTCVSLSKTKNKSKRHTAKVTTAMTSPVYMYFIHIPKYVSHISDACIHMHTRETRQTRLCMQTANVTLPASGQICLSTSRLGLFFSLIVLFSSGTPTSAVCARHRRETGRREWRQRQRTHRLIVFWFSYSWWEVALAQILAAVLLTRRLETVKARN